MSAVYDEKSFATLWSACLSDVETYVQENPGKSLDEVATALSIPYEVAWQCCQSLGYVIVPSTSGEIHWHAHKP